MCFLTFIKSKYRRSKETPKEQPVSTKFCFDKNDGKKILDNLDVEIKSGINEKFGSLENFYVYIWAISFQEYLHNLTHEKLEKKFDKIIQWLCSLGMDDNYADDLVYAISEDFTSFLAINLLGKDGEKILNDSMKIYGDEF